MLKWTDLNLPPLNLWSFPSPNSMTYTSGCKHQAWLVEHSMKRKTCYDCGKVEITKNNMPSHQR
jgi:hypothetical protein